MFRGSFAVGARRTLPVVAALARSLRTRRRAPLSPKPLRPLPDPTVSVEDKGEIPTSATDATNIAWNWVPPRQQEGGSNSGATRNDDAVIPVIPNQLLTPEEIKKALVSLGGEDVVCITLSEKLDTITDMIIATGKSTRQIKKMSDVIVQALKTRNLYIAPGFTGAEGEKDDDWLVVDTYNCAVHLMLPVTRKCLDLENHWAPGNQRPFVVYDHNEARYERSFENLLEKHPVPDEYNALLAAAEEEHLASRKTKKGGQLDGNVRTL